MNKIGLCFAGGGARGAYQIGAVKALEEMGIFQHVSVFSGTSIGAVNACMVATKSIDEIYELWKNITPDMLHSTESFFKRLIKERMELADNGIFEINVLRELLQQHLNLEKLRKKKVYIAISEGGAADTGIFGLLKASYRHYVKKDSKVVYIPIARQKKPDIYNFILASCSIPIVFSGISINDRKYYDGAVYDNVPVKPLIDAGCDTVIVVHLHKFNFFDKAKHPGINFYEIKHKNSLGGILNFDPEQAEKTYQLGYQDTIAFFQTNPINL